MYLPNPELFSPEVAPIVEPWRKALMDAAEYIRERGWCQGDYERMGRVCILGALRIVTGQKTDGTPETAIPQRKLIEHLGYAGLPHQWNDERGRTKEQVISALESAARQ